MKKSTADYFNQLGRDLQADPDALRKRFAADMGSILGQHVRTMEQADAHVQRALEADETNLRG